MSESVTLRRSRRRPRAILMVPLLSALILVLGWSVLWAVARQQAAAGLDRWIGAEAAHGRVWSCPDRTIEGYPFRIALSCRDVSFNGVVDGSPGEGHLAGFSARTWVYEPNSIYVVLDGPLSLTTADGRADFSLAWARFGAKLRGFLGERRRMEVVGEDFELTRPDAAASTVRRLELHAGPAVIASGTGAPAGPDASADVVDIALTGATWPALDVVSGEGATLDGSFSGVVTRALGDLPDFGPATVERWRRSGGRLDVSNLTLTKGPLSLAAAGTLGLDDLHRLRGRLESSLGGFEPLAKRFGVSLRAVAVGGLLANLLGTKPAATSPAGAAPPGTVTLPITFADGTVAVGPINTGLRLPPLY